MSEVNPITAKDLAKRLDVSDRTIRHYIQQVNEESTYVGASQEGYRLLKYPAKLLHMDHDQQTNRSIYLFTAMTDSQYGANLYDIAEELEISITTLETDVKKLKRKIERDNLKLIRKNNTFFLHGEESNLRKLYRSLLLGNDTISPWNIGRYNDLLNAVDIQHIRALIDREMKCSGYYLNDFALMSLFKFNFYMSDFI